MLDKPFSINWTCLTLYKSCHLALEPHFHAKNQEHSEIPKKLAALKLNNRPDFDKKYLNKIKVLAL